jgi:hypothetical protein|tara:strand:+ start:288 stop:908 length:621 start_codon:yes stop_codon:yes gene_type:complete
MSKKIILHLCADIGSDSRFYQLDDSYEVIKIGIEIGVENYTPPKNVYGVVANPVCTEFSRARNANIESDHEKGMFLVNHCLRIIKECNPNFWLLENPSSGDLRKHIGKPKYTYHPWHFGSPWTKATGLWGEFNMPEKKYLKWEDVPKNDKLYIKPKATKPALAALHKSSKELIPEMEWAKHLINDDMSIRSWCSQKFAKAFYDSNP